MRALHTLTDRERDRLSRWGPQLVGPDAPPARLRPALAHPTVRRELRWLVRHATLGLLTGLAGLLLPLFAVRDLTFPLWWRLAPADASMTSLGLGTADGWPEAVSVGLMGVGWVAIIVGLAPAMARAQASPGRRLLPAGAETDVALRIAELTASRAAALDAHAAELRRIERALHDGGFATRMILTVHDELVFEVPLDERDAIEPVVREAMEGAIELNVPLAADEPADPLNAEQLDDLSAEGEGGAARPTPRPPNPPPPIPGSPSSLPGSLPVPAASRDRGRTRPPDAQRPPAGGGR